MAIIDVAGGELPGQQFAVMIDDQMQLEAEEPANRVLAPLRQPSKDAVLMDARILADGNRSRIHKADAGTSTAGMNSMKRE